MRLLVILFALLTQIPTWASAAELPPVVATINGQEITAEMLLRGNAMEFYEMEKSLYELQSGKLKQLLIERFIQLDPKSQTIKPEEYISRYIVKPMNVTEKMVDDFIVQQRIPQDKINPQLRQQVKQYIFQQDYKRQVNIWFGIQAAKHNVAIMLPEPVEPRFQINISNAASQGPANAPVTIIEFADFECPYCVKADATMKSLRQKYGDKLRVVFKHLPLEMHANAPKAAEASECAREQGNQYFWQMHDRMFANSRNLTIGVIKDQAKTLPLNYPAFSQCLDSGKYAAKINADMIEAASLGVNATPAFFINGKLINGNRDIQVFIAAIEAELAKKSK